MSKFLEALTKIAPTVEDAIKLKGKKREKYLELLDKAYGDKAKRAKDLGFGDKVYYHGTNKNIDKFDPNKTTHNYSAFVTPDKNVAKVFAEKNLDAEGGQANIYNLMLRGDIKNPYIDLKKANLLDAHSDKWDMANTWKTIEHGEGVKNFLDSKGIKNVEMTEQMGDSLDKLSVGNTKTSRTIAVSDPKDIRSTDAAFDPRFKDSDYILALNQGNKKSFGQSIMDKLGAPQRYVSERLAEKIGIVPKKSSEENFQEISQAVAEKIAQKTGINPNSPAANAAKALAVAAGEVFLDPLGMVPFGKIAKGAKAVGKMISQSEKAQKLQKIMDLVKKTPNAPIAINPVAGSGEAVKALEKLGHQGPTILKGKP